MIKFLRGVLTVIIITIFTTMIIAISAYISYNDYIQNKYIPGEVEIIVEEEISVYLKQNYQITPYLINGDKEIEDGQYRYESNNSNIIVTDRGCVTANNIPEEDCIITIYETNHNIQKNIKINVIEGISNIFDIIALNGLSMKYNENYQFEVKYLQNEYDIKNYVEFETFDNEGNKIEDVLTLTIDQNILTFHTIGLGEGKLLIALNGNSQVFDFRINLENQVLSENATNGGLINSAQIKNLETIYYTGNELDVEDLIVFDSLENVAFESTEIICKCRDLKEIYTYYVKEELFLDYYNDNNWKKYQSKIVPYRNSIENDKFVIYHDQKTNTLECKKVNNLFEFKLLSYPGYKHNKKWSISNTEELVQSIDDILTSESNCINLYAVWTPINYKVEYHSSIGNTDKVLQVIDCEYNQKFNIEILHNHKLIGYTFVGWSSEVNKTTLIDEEDVNSVEYKLTNNEFITINNLTTVDNDVIKLYDVWRPNKYTVVFERVEGCEAEMINIVNSISMEFGKIYDLANNEENNEFFDIPGYNIIKWKTESGKEYNLNNSKILNLTTEDNAVVKLTPTLEDKIYDVILKLPNNFDMNSGSLNQYKKYISEVPYTGLLKDAMWLNDSDQVSNINLNLTYYPTYEGYHWFIDLNNNNVEDENEPLYNPIKGLIYNNIFSIKDFEYFNIDSDGKANLIICPKGVSSHYYLSVDLDGGNLSGAEVVQNLLLENEKVNFTFNSPSKSGYSHSGWIVYIYDNSDNLKTTLEYNTKTITINQSKINGVLIDNLDNLDKIKIVAKYNLLYTLTFKDGSEVLTKVVLEAGQTVPKISNPTKNGAYFNAWDIDIPTIMPAYDLTFNATWTYIQYSITYNTNGGNLATEINSYTIIDAITLVEPTRSGYAFAGWYENSSFTGSKITQISKGNTGNKTYYAKWLNLSESWVASVENGRRDLAVTDSDGVIETVKFNNINVAELVALGYTKVTLSITLDAREKPSGLFGNNDGYQQFWIYSGTTNTQITEEEFEHGPGKELTSWKTYSFEYSYNLTTLLNNDSQFKIEYGARGDNNDDWEVGYTTYTIVVSK